MSNQEKNTEEKVVTKYDLKMQRREEAKKQAKKEKIVNTIVGVAVVVALCCLVLSFLIRSYLTVNGTYIKVAGEKVSRVEYDYHFYTVKNNFVTQYGSYMSMYGIDLSGDLSKTMYTDTLTWQDYFDELAVEDIKNKKAMRDKAKAEGFVYDSAEDYAKFQKTIKDGAAELGITESAYLKQLYGDLATASRIKPYVEEALMTTSYYAEIAEQKAATDEQIQAYYEENKDSYDSVDYRLTTIRAELPTEPTELADPVEETEATEGEETAYKPSEAEIAHAMELAKAEADEAVKKVATEGDLKENLQKGAISSLLSEWLFDASRKAGDTTIIESTTANCYYVLAFEKRYLDETPSVNARIILLEGQEENAGQNVVDEWKNGAATEDSFAALADKYNDSILELDGGYYDALLPTGMPIEMAAWTAEEGRKNGDVASFAPAGDNYTYVIYFIGYNEPSWKLDIQNTLLSDTMTSYMEEICVGYEVEDPKGNLNYLTVQANDAAADTESTAE